MRIKLPITLTPKQREVDESPARFKVVKAGRRAGKTKYGSYWTGKNALTLPGKHWYVCNGLDLIRDEMWPHLCELLRDYIQYKDDRLFRMRVSNRVFESVINCKSAERGDAMRGRGLRSLNLDEASFVRPQLWDRVLRPTLADYKAPALISSSAKKGWFTRTFDYAAKAGDADWAAFLFTVYENPYIDRAEIETIRRSTPLDVWNEEYLAVESSHSGQVYAESSEKSIYDPDARFQGAPGWPVVIGMDWGTMANASAIWVHVSPEGYLAVSREHVRNNWDVGRHASVIKGYCAGLSGSVREFVLDRSAFREESTGISVADQYRKCGIYCQRSEKDVDGGVNLIKQFLRGDGEKPWLFVSTACPMLIAALQEWEHDAHEPDALVALRYAVTHLVRRSLTPLAHKFPDFMQARDMSPELAVEETIKHMRAPYRLPVQEKRSGWTWGRDSWDYDAGAPG